MRAPLGFGRTGIGQWAVRVPTPSSRGVEPWTSGSGGGGEGTASARHGTRILRPRGRCFSLSGFSGAGRKNPRSIMLRRHLNRRRIVDQFASYYQQHGYFPRSTDAVADPVLPSPSTVERHLGVRGWEAAIARIAAELRVRPGMRPRSSDGARADAPPASPPKTPRTAYAQAALPPALDRTCIRAVLFDFAEALAAAETASEVTQVLCGLDVYVDRMLTARGYVGCESRRGEWLPGEGQPGR